LHCHHYLVSDTMKYIWFSDSGQEMLFHLKNDPRELHNLATDADAEKRLGPWRVRMMQALKGRPEGFSDGQRLIPGRLHEKLVPGYTPEYQARFE
jgi:hypothetical protein